jgi:quercetin dioxygenase-like cupin family protein
MTEINKPSFGDGLMGKALRLADLVAYQEDAVVSRTVIDKKVGTVTLFAFAKGQGLSEHTAPYDALVFIADGTAEITIAGNPLTAQAGDMVIMPANRPHALRATERFKMLLVMIRA